MPITLDMNPTTRSAGKTSLVLFAIFAVTIMLLGVISFLTACPNFTNAPCSPSSPNLTGLVAMVLGAIVWIPALIGSMIYGVIFLTKETTSSPEL